jgi:hypothetical protein
MKKVLKAITFSLAVVAIALSSWQCGSSKKAVNPVTTGEETRIEQFCTGPDFRSDNDYFRANAVGESMDQNVSKQKALTNARTLLAQQIEVTVKNVTDNYIKAAEMDNVEGVEERIEGMSREVTNQKLNGTRIICEELTKTKDGNYKTYLAIELSGDEIATAMQQRLSNDDKLRIDFDYEKFKKTFEEEMSKMQ